MKTEYTSYTVKKKKIFWKKNPLNGAIDIRIDGIPDFKMYCRNDDTVVKELYWTGFKHWEPTSLQLWFDLLQISKKGLVLDIGCYTGIYSIIAAMNDKTKEVYAFDVQEVCIERLNTNSQLNNIQNINSVNAACSDSNGEDVYFFYEEDQIIPSVAGLKPNKMNNLERRIRSFRLDEYLRNLNLKKSVSLIKIDVEGAELRTLDGMQEILSSDLPDVLIEVNNPNEIKAVKKKFPAQYTAYDIDEDRMLISKLTWWKKPSRHRNYLFTIRTKKQLSRFFTGEVK